MNDDLCLLVMIFQEHVMGNSLIRCALRIPHGLNAFDQTDHMMEHAARIRGMLPEHIRSIGPICRIEHIDEIIEGSMPDFKERGE